MKKGVGSVIFLFSLLVFSVSLVSAAQCDLDVLLLNQDPYPASPGEYVKVVFQLTGIDNSECDKVTFELDPRYPFSLDPGVKSKVSLFGGTYIDDDYKTHWLIPYDVRVDKDALDGDNPLKVRFDFEGSGSEIGESKDFDVNVQDVRTNFEISIKDYDDDTNSLTLEILNFGEHDAEALTVEIERQENINVKGNSKNIVGSLDANDDTTFSFEAVPKDGEILLTIVYTDEINVRRKLDKTITYDSSYFTGRKADEIVSKPVSFYVSIGLIILMILIWFRERWKKKKHKEKIRALHHRQQHSTHHKK